MNILITGAAGFTGRALVRRLSQENDARIFGLDRVRIVGPSPFEEYFEMDLRDPAATRAIVEKTKPDWLFHLAGLLKGDASQLFQVNTQNTVHLLEAAAAGAPNARVLLIGSAAEYGFSSELDGQPIPETHPCRPVAPYGVSKYAATLAGQDFARRTGLRVNIARTFNLIGPGLPPSMLPGAIVFRVKEALALGKDFITVGNVSAERDFIDVRDACDAYIKIMESDARGEVINVCTGERTRIQSIVGQALAMAPRPIRYEVDQSLLRPDDPKCVIGDPSKMKSLGTAPKIPLAESIREMCAGIGPV